MYVIFKALLDGEQAWTPNSLDIIPTPHVKEANNANIIVNVNNVNNAR